MRKWRLKDLIKLGFLVWCRDGRVCNEATLCSECECKYKKHKEDITKCLKCRMFQITANASSWNSANQMFFKFGSIEQER